MNYIVGIDIGGTNLVLGCVAEDGSVVHGLRSEPTRAEDGPDSIIGRLAVMARDTMAECRRADPGGEILGVGIGSPGPLNTRTGVVLLTPNLGWLNMPLRDRLSQALQLPATLDNDANCAVLGEWWQGAARDTHTAVGITIGTGIGGGLILHGRLFHGASDVAGEIGHCTVEINGRRCKCGNDGCLEAYASGPAIAQRAVERLQTGEESIIPGQVGGDLHRVTAQTVYDAAHAGDTLAQEVVADTARFLGAGVAGLVNLLNPEVVVVCGGVTEAGDKLFVPLRREVARRAFKPAVEVCRIVPGALPGTAGVIGAARSFIEQTSHPASRHEDLPEPHA